MLTDFHSHILPQIDDGSTGVAESMEMLRLEKAQGIRHVIATPHFYPHKNTPERFLKKRNEARSRLMEAMSGQTDLPVISTGAEVAFFLGISDSDALGALAIGESPYVLIEMPYSPWTKPMYQELENIYLKQGLIPIIAHIDRYLRPFHSLGDFQTLSGLPVLVQANADFFLNRYTAGKALGLLKKDRIQLLGSDCHNLTSRLPNLGDAVNVIRRRLGIPVLERIKVYERDILAHILPHQPDNP